MTCTASKVPFCRVTVWPEKGNNLNTITPPTLSGMTMDQHYDELYKVVLVGDPGVGKTNLLATFLASDSVNENGVSRSFSAVRKPTIGVEFATAIVRHPNGKRLKAQIWDTAGQERYRAITSSHYRRAAGALIVFDVTSRETFDNAHEHWLKELKAAAGLSSTLTSCIMLVGNKVDLESPQAMLDTNYVDPEQHEAAATTLGLMHQRASAKTCHNVRQAFEDLVIAIYDADKSKAYRPDAPPAIQLNQQTPVSQQSTPKSRGAASKTCC
ncbi:hypothetical protein PF005_g12079 [Phytophthora fragariae]|uniref:Ras-related protein n=3 Tax=Phytophthora TaxID=4783 RepID=A0A6A3EW12_9STRA|nr:hypothetical protein PF003_g10434 [Phytophthora fragariae]KAE9027997.1 hypothetical protein PR002_g10524 [Phytophthora rubi]KAE8936813.1 hypothetical protein PF009_g13262 [Phytophthora fragariae]KAE9007796.1 hypothetical protein PF011_g10964 [Phytophthora fragariae]KAE9032871.1 hypothetical protein PR001_g10401 [Phytophthora rubi]